jgi:CheY-like chemotaxis protein
MHVLDAEPTTSMTPLTDLKILLVDDDRDALSMMRRILEEHGAAVELAQSADEGLRLLGDRAFDVIVSDIGMPIRDGYDLIADVRTRGIRVPALAVTAYASAEDRRRAIGAGYQAHVAKPVDTTEFLVAVAALAGRH